LFTNSLQAQRKQYEEQGYTVFRQVLSKSLLAEINRHLNWLRNQQSGSAKTNLYTAPIKNDPFWARLVSEKNLLDLAELLIGPDIALFGANYVIKRAGDAAPALWHQDGPNWQLIPLQALTLWIAIDDSTPANGCLRVIPASHQLELYKLQPANQTPNIFGWQTDPLLVDEEKAVDIVLKAGDVSAHHPKLIHGSGANNSDKRRAGMSIRYIPATTCIAGNTPSPNALLLRGKAQPGINQYHDFPKYIEGFHMPFDGCENWK
jgi:ectoine hydroxylase-related dioxygenase (phytanoyl-CoA dioxygenase family)